MPRELALVGGGHAHVEVIRRFGEAPIADTRLTVFDPNPRPVYSGMVPGFVAGRYRRDELEIDLKPLCERAGARFVQAAVTRVARDALELDDGTSRAFQLASLDIGSSVTGLDRPGVREFALPSRPIATLVAQVREAFSGASKETPIYVVGGGAGGVELAFCLQAHLREQAGSRREVAIVTNEASVLADAAPALRRRVERALRRRGIRVLPDALVSSVERQAITLEGGRQLAASGAIWVTGPAAHPLARHSALPVDARGFVVIEPTLQVRGSERLFAVGDCASLDGMKKAGVYAVRAGPLLDANLRAALAGEALRAFTPQSEFLSLLNLGDGTAIGGKWGLALEGRAMMWLKDRIDRAFLARYQ